MLTIPTRAMMTASSKSTYMSPRIWSNCASWRSMNPALLSAEMPPTFLATRFTTRAASCVEVPGGLITPT